ncbi:Acyl-CoA N-acyltransferase [Penicillium soppii]|jgi:RimJ/RimL family protein N-acetyltransferase|uniref:Acyl-CoA N-acyltransferase n=1 Tax=Penicillium soppii TaxID=69789 RepID=UPI002546956F|nr:Acyl-CoA N-acyltransferase [Penicillium soppii]KAJ5852184.1 Acyl-CoA N-acyltransferase [Penicillium soppii]
MASDEFVTVKTFLPTLPLPANSERAEITTNRLLIRALQPGDLAAFRVLRTQQDVMKWTKAGCIDETIEITKSKLDPFLPPNDLITANCAICLKDTGEFIGIGGCHLYPASHGWPEVGYMLRKEQWGQGFGTEFLSAWLRFWSELPRSKREVQVQKEMVDREGSVDEHLIAITEVSNVPSQRVLLKSGFERFREFDEVDDGKTVNLVAFRYLPSKTEWRKGL